MHDSAITIVIDSFRNSGKNALFFAWMVCLAFVGIYTIYAYTTGEYIQKQKIFMLVFLGFWLYYMIKVGKAFLWRLYGKEMLLLNDEGMSIKNDIRTYGKAIFIDIDAIEKVVNIDKNEVSFMENMRTSYWNISGDALLLKNSQKTIVFGKDLSEKERDRIRKVLNEQILKFKK